LPLLLGPYTGKSENLSLTLTKWPFQKSPFLVGISPNFNIPSPSRGGLGWGWDNKFLKEIESHPPPNLPLEEGGVKFSDVVNFQISNVFG
jgi:hypothetical protein